MTRLLYGIQIHCGVDMCYLLISLAVTEKVVEVMRADLVRLEFGKGV